MFKNIILDMGNVLLTYNPEIPLSEFCSCEKSKDRIRKELFQGEEWVQADLGLMTPEQMYNSVKLRVPEEYHSELKKCVYHWDICMQPLPGAKEFLNKMKALDCHIYVLSNASPHFYDYFPKHYALDFFDGIVVSCDLHLLKPDKQIYTYLLDKYHLSASDCLFVDDTPVNVEGAKAVGIHGYIFDGDFSALLISIMSYF